MHRVRLLRARSKANTVAQVQHLATSRLAALTKPKTMAGARHVYKSPHLKLYSMFKILVPVDFTGRADQAARYALELATATPEAQLLLLHCFSDYLLEPELEKEPPASFYGKAQDAESITEQVLHRNQIDEEQKLTELQQQLQGLARSRGLHVNVQQAFVHGLPEEAIPDEINRYKPDLVVMGTKGESNLARSLFGTITTKMAQELNTPVLTVPEHDAPRRPDKVLYATDFDAVDAEAIQALQRLLQAFAPTIYCLHIADSDTRADRRELEKLQAALQGSTTDSRLRFILLEGDDVATALLDFVARQQIGLTALTHRKRSFLDKIFQTSLTKRMVLEAHVPLLVFNKQQA